MYLKKKMRKKTENQVFSSISFGVVNSKDLCEQPPGFSECSIFSTLPGTKPTWGKGKSSTQKCQMVGDMLDPRKVSLFLKVFQTSYIFHCFQMLNIIHCALPKHLFPWIFCWSFALVPCTGYDQKNPLLRCLSRAQIIHHRELLSHHFSSQP